MPGESRRPPGSSRPGTRVRPDGRPPDRHTRCRAHHAARARAARPSGGRGRGRRGRGPRPHPGRGVRGEARHPAGARQLRRARSRIPTIDAIYNPLPNGLHAEWTEQALRGRASTCCARSRSRRTRRKPSGSPRSPPRPDLVVMEAFHYRYHPVAERMRAIAQSGELGELRRIETSMCIPLPLPNDIRYRYDLARRRGHGRRLLRHAHEPARGRCRAERRRAEAKLARPDVDRWLHAELRYSDGLSGSMTCALFSGDVAEDPGEGDGRPRHALGVQPDRPAVRLPHHRAAAGTKRRVKVEGAKTPTYSVPARPRSRTRCWRRHAGAHAAGGLDRQHARHRRDLRGGRPSGPGDVMELRQPVAYIARSRVGLGLATMRRPGPTLTAVVGRGANTAAGRARAPVDRRARRGDRSRWLDRGRAGRGRRRLALDVGARRRVRRRDHAREPRLAEAGPAHRARRARFGRVPPDALEAARRRRARRRGRGLSPRRAGLSRRGRC